MNPQDPLAGLHPLREPPLIEWWPPAPGWWILLAMVLLVLLALGYVQFRRYRASAYRRWGLVQLQALRDALLADQDRCKYIAGTNALLKTVALRAFPRRQVAACSGEAWLVFLNDSSRSPQAFEAGFVTAAYLKACPELDLDRLHQQAANWIVRHEADR